MSIPLLSAALIVRDESHHLQACLSSLGKIVDEIIIVDTGSKDKTLAIARRYTQNVYEIPWQNDFSAARNEALDKCRGQWILYIDADERVRQNSLPGLHQQLIDPTLVGCYLWLHPTPRQSGYREMRLFRNHSKIRFEGCIHENIWPALKRHMSNEGGKIGYCELSLDHVGYEGNQTYKYQRNLPLLLSKLEDDPEHAFSLWHLGSVYKGLGQNDLAEQAWSAGVDAARRRKYLEWADALSFISLIELNHTNPHFSETLLEEALQRYPDHPHLVWLKAKTKMRNRQFYQAIKLWYQLKNWNKHSHVSDGFLAIDLRLFDLFAFEGLATCFFRLGGYSKAKYYYQLAEQYAPDKQEFFVKQQLCAQLLST